MWNFQEVQSKSVEYLSKIKTNIKSYKKEKEKLKTTLFDLEKSKLKYLKSFHDWEESDASYQAAEKDGTLARNEIQRIKLESEARHKHYVAQTEAYQQQLKVTNTRQSDHYRWTTFKRLNRVLSVKRGEVTFFKCCERYHKTSLTRTTTGCWCRTCWTHWRAWSGRGWSWCGECCTVQYSTVQYSTVCVQCVCRCSVCWAAASRRRGT